MPARARRSRPKSSITTWYVFEQAFPYSGKYLPMSGDNWSQGMYGGAYYPDETAKFLADLVNASPYKKRLLCLV